jgi:hypothetical protein
MVYCKGSYFAKIEGTVSVSVDTEENHENYSHSNLPQGQDLNPEPPSAIHSGMTFGLSFDVT